MSEQTDRLDTAESLRVAYERIIPANSDTSRASEKDSYSLAQPYAGRSVPSFVSDNTDPKAPY
jgi:hypothetical protein